MCGWCEIIDKEIKVEGTPKQKLAWKLAGELAQLEEKIVDRAIKQGLVKSQEDLIIVHLAARNVIMTALNARKKR